MEQQVLKLSSQAVGALMMTLQKSLLEQSDIVPLLEKWELLVEGGEVYVKNPPIVKVEGDEVDA